MRYLAGLCVVGLMMAVAAPAFGVAVWSDQDPRANGKTQWATNAHTPLAWPPFTSDFTPVYNTTNGPMGMSNFLRIQTRPDLYSVGGNINYKPDYDWNLAHGYSGTQWVTLLKLADFGPDGVLKVRWSYWAPGLNPGVDPLTIQVLDQSFTTAYYTQWLTDGYANNGFWAGGHSEAVNDYGADFESTYGLWKLTSPILGTWNYKVEYQDANDNWTSTFTSYWDGSTLQGGGAFQVVPEPLTMAGLMLGIGSLVGYVRKRRKA